MAKDHLEDFRRDPKPEPYQLTDSSAMLFKDFLAHYNGRVKDRSGRCVVNMEDRCDGAIHWARFNGSRRNATISDVANELNRMCSNASDNARHVSAVLNFAMDRLPVEFIEAVAGLLKPFQAHALYMAWQDRAPRRVLRLLDRQRGNSEKWTVPDKVRRKAKGLPDLDEAPKEVLVNRRHVKIDDRRKKKGGAA